MYFLSKCSEKGCKRSGTVALKFGSKYCNLHDEISITKEIEFKNKDEENPQAIEPRLEDEDNKLE